MALLLELPRTQITKNQNLEDRRKEGPTSGQFLPPTDYFKRFVFFPPSKFNPSISIPLPEKLEGAYIITGILKGSQFSFLLHSHTHTHPHYPSVMKMFGLVI